MAMPRAGLQLLGALIWLLLPHASCQIVSSAGLGQEFNTSAAIDGESLAVLQSPSRNFVLFFNNQGERAPPFYTLLIIGPLISSDVGLVYSGTWSARVVQLIQNNCSLRLENDGNLVLLDYNQTVYWQTNTSHQGVVSMALLDSGNLVLLDAANRTLWQSFDYPSDTLVLGQRLTAGASMLTQGPYSLGLRDTGLYLFYSAADQLLPYWQLYPYTTRTPALSQALGVAEVTRDAMQLFASSNTSALLGSIPFPTFASASKLDHSWWLLQLNGSGFLDGFRANSSQYQYPFSLPAMMPPCAIPDSCGGPYYVCAQDSGNCSSCPLVAPPDGSALDSSCAVSSVLAYPNCFTQEDVAAHQFLNLSGFTYFAVGFNDSTVSASLEDCADVCLHNCSCKAAFYVTTTSSCLRVSAVSNLINASGKADHLAFIKYQQQQESSDQPSGPSPGSTAGLLPGSEGREARYHSATVKIIGGVFGAMAALLMIFICLYCWRKKGKGGDAVDDKDGEEAFLATLPSLPPRFTLKELKACTENFSQKLGAGGCGAVYEGVHPRDGVTRVAVKQLDLGASKQGSRPFQAEIATIGSIQHVNLVRLHGFCMEGPHRLLVYELMSNGSLDAYLRKSQADGSSYAKHGPLPWRTRLGIALGTARGLAYLHDECRERIIHCDIKPENILLNHQLEPTISDFGLAKLMSREQSYAATTMRGTRGYLAPEWWRNAPITEKSDVYSYGMVLLELVSGRRLFDAHVAILERQYLPEWVRSLDQARDQGRAAFAEIIDERVLIGTEQDIQEVENVASQVVAIAILCIQEDPNARPSMATVMKMLQGDVQVPAIPPSTSTAVLSRISSLSSCNPLTMSSVYPR